jgi:nucleoside-diphosphate-sugar epimerase
VKALITGGTGLLGSELARILVDRDERPVVIDVSPPRGRLAALGDRFEFEPVSVTEPEPMLRLIQARAVDVVFHLGGMLSLPSESDPQAAVQVNAQGTYNVLEAARRGGAQKVIFASSIAVYGLDLPDGPVNDDTLQRPTSMYGACKVFGELLGRYFARRFGLDFRGLRFPSVVGPGFQVAHMSIYNCWAIEEPLKGNPYRLQVEPATRCPAIYYKDAVRALISLAEAPASEIVSRVYNLAGVKPPFSAGELVEAVRRSIPGADLDFEPDQQIIALLAGLGNMDLDETNARRQWGWRPDYDLEAMIDDFIDEFRRHRDLYKKNEQG